MNYAFRIIGYPLVLLAICWLTASKFDETEKSTVLLFFFFVVTVEPLAAVFDFPFRFFRRRKRVTDAQ